MSNVVRFADYRPAKVVDLRSRLPSDAEIARARELERELHAIGDLYGINEGKLPTRFCEDASKDEDLTPCA